MTCYFAYLFVMPSVKFYFDFNLERRSTDSPCSCTVISHASGGNDAHVQMDVKCDWSAFVFKVYII